MILSKNCTISGSKNLVNEGKKQLKQILLSRKSIRFRVITQASEQRTLSKTCKTPGTN